MRGSNSGETRSKSPLALVGTATGGAVRNGSHRIASHPIATAHRMAPVHFAMPPLIHSSDCVEKDPNSRPTGSRPRLRCARRARRRLYWSSLRRLDDRKPRIRALYRAPRCNPGVAAKRLDLCCRHLCGRSYGTLRPPRPSGRSGRHHWREEVVSTRGNYI